MPRPLQKAVLVCRFRQNPLYRSGFQPVDTPASEPCLGTEFSSLCSAAEFACMSSPRSPHALKSFLLGTHAPKYSLEPESLRKRRHKPLFHAGCQPEQKRSLLLIYSVSFQQESTPLLPLSDTHTGTHSHSQKSSCFQGMINSRVHCWGELQSGPPACSRQEKRQSFSWIDQLCGQHEA